MIVVVDDADRENEGDLTLAAEHASPEAINFMARYGRGLICLAMTEQRLDHLNIPLVSQRNTSVFGTAFSEPNLRRSARLRFGPTPGMESSTLAVAVLRRTCRW